MYDVVVEFPRMKVAVRTRDERVIDISYLPPASPIVAPRTALGERAARQLEAYRANPDFAFDLPLLVEGTPDEIKGNAQVQEAYLGGMHEVTA